MQPKSNQKGFSLIELLIVVSIIGIIAAMAIPNLLSSKAAANEASALSSTRIIISSQYTYQMTSGRGNYAGQLDLLENANLIDPALASGSKSGFLFSLTVSRAGQPADFCVSANPQQSGSSSSGYRRFGASSEGLLRYDDTPSKLTTPFTLSTIGSATPVN